MERNDQPGMTNLPGTGELETGSGPSTTTGLGGSPLGGGAVGAGPALGGSSDADDVTEASAGASGMAGAGGEISGEVRKLGDTLRDKAREVTGRTKTQVRDGLSQRKTQVGERIGEVASAFHRTSESLREQRQDRLAEYSDMVGSRVDQAATYFRDKELDEVLRDLETAARRQPAVFLGGAFVLGLLAARFLKSSARSEDNGGSAWHAADSYGDDYESAEFDDAFRTPGDDRHVAMDRGGVASASGVGDDLGGMGGSSAEADLGLGLEAR